MGYDRDGYGKTEYMVVYILLNIFIKKDIWTSGRARNVENKN
jgi:hypothetical protein